MEKQKEDLKPRIIHFSSSIESLKQRIRLVNQNYSNEEQDRIANQLRLLNQEKSSLNSEHTKIMKELSEANAKVSVVEDRKRLRKNALLRERSSSDNEKNELESAINTFEKDMSTSQEELTKLRDKEQELISTSGTSVSTLSEFDGPLVETLEKEYNALSPSLNAGAVQKYYEISTGYRTMSNRKNDLEAERNSIWAFIESIEKDKKQTFLDAFDTVDKEIRKIFTKMNGGNAWLELENEDDIFNSGVSYLIQFQNKPKRESTSISGGEKTLAAVVFVLGLQKLKPSPFYLFDEIDAHLDAPNSESLSKIVEERSRGSQFIMVSLKDSVVEKAKLIYGVYPKNGVSNVVTYKDKRIPSITS